MSGISLMINMAGAGGQVPPSSVYPGEFDLATDPYAANVVFLMHANGSNGSTALVDEKGHTIINQGHQLTTSYYSAGTASMNVSSSTTMAYVNSNLSDFNFGTGDFCIEFSIRAPQGLAAGVINPILYRHSAYNNLGGGGSASFAVFQHGNQFYCQDAVGNGIYTRAISFSDGNFHKIKFSRKSGLMYSYVDGLAGAATTNFSTPSNTVIPFVIAGNNVYPNTQPGQYQLDEIRITKGVSRN